MTREMNVDLVDDTKFRMLVRLLVRLKLINVKEWNNISTEDKISIMMEGMIGGF